MYNAMRFVQTSMLSQHGVMFEMIMKDCIALKVSFWLVSVVLVDSNDDDDDKTMMMMARKSVALYVQFG